MEGPVPVCSIGWICGGLVGLSLIDLLGEDLGIWVFIFYFLALVRAAIFFFLPSTPPSAVMQHGECCGLDFMRRIRELMTLLMTQCDW